MKVGDKLYCIKKSYVYRDNDRYSNFTHNKIYVIREWNIRPIILDDNNYIIFLTDMIDNQEIEGHSFYDYFYTEQQLRKIKLKKLNESR